MHPGVQSICIRTIRVDLALDHSRPPAACSGRPRRAHLCSSISWARSGGFNTMRRLSEPRTTFAMAWYSSIEGNPPVPYVFALPDVSFSMEMLKDKLIDTQ